MLRLSHAGQDAINVDHTENARILKKKSKTIQFTGGIFANNKNKQETQETLSEILNLLRFNTVNYKWYEYDDEYTYYELDTKRDNEISE